MEQPTTLEITSALERVIQAFATAGRTRWRSKVTDISELERLPAVQAELDRKGRDVHGESAVGRDVNASRNAIEAAIWDAIERLPEPFAAAAGEHFGFSNEHTTQDARFELAAGCLGYTTPRWYDKARNEPPYSGLKPRNYVIRLVTCGLAGIDDPIAYLNTSPLGPGGPLDLAHVQSSRRVSTTQPEHPTPHPNAVQINVPAGAAAVLAAQAYRLGVRRSPAGTGFAVPPDESTEHVRLSRYVRRAELDDPLDAAVSCALDRHGVHAITLEGFSYTGKSRALLQALGRQTRSFRFLAPQSADQICALLDDQLDQASPQTAEPTILWLDPLERFSGPTDCGWLEQLRQHATRHTPIVLLAGLGGTAGVPVDPGTREFLQLEHPLDRLRDLGLSSAVTLVEHRASERGFDADGALDHIRLAYDAKVEQPPGPWESAARDGGFLRALAHGGQLELRYRSGWPDHTTVDPRGQAAAWAVMAWRRAVQSDDPVGVETIERLARCSPLGSRGHIATESQLNAALEWACEPTLDNASSLISPVRTADTTAAGFRAEAFLAEALVQPHELTPEVWSIIESAAPASRRVVVRQGLNVATVQAHGTPEQAESFVNVSLRRPVDTRGPGSVDGPTTEPNAVTSVAFRTGGGFEGRLQAFENRVALVLWSAPASLATTLAVRLAPASDEAAAADTPQPVVIVAESIDGFWELPTNLAVPRTPAAWRSLAESLRFVTISPHAESVPAIDTVPP